MRPTATKQLNKRTQTVRVLLPEHFKCNFTRAEVSCIEGDICARDAKRPDGVAGKFLLLREQCSLHRAHDGWKNVSQECVRRFASTFKKVMHAGLVVH